VLEPFPTSAFFAAEVDDSPATSPFAAGILANVGWL